MGGSGQVSERIADIIGGIRHLPYFYDIYTVYLCV